MAVGNQDHGRVAMPVATMLPSTVHQPGNLTLGEVASLDCQVFDGWSAFSGPRFHRNKAPILEAYWSSTFLAQLKLRRLGVHRDRQRGAGRAGVRRRRQPRRWGGGGPPGGGGT